MLEAILAHKRAELAASGVATGARRRRAVHSLRKALARPGARFVLECKRASPSAGPLYTPASLTTVFDAYDGVADAVSVLTDARYFGGSLADLSEAAARFSVPVLRKDFMIDPSQVPEAFAHGADAVLLMLSVLDDAAYRACAREARRLGIEVLTEVHDDNELERALSLDAPVIGINNRSLTDLTVDMGVVARLAPRIPRDRVIVCESGIDGHDAVRRLAPRVDAFLVGSTLMRAPNIGHAVRETVFGQVKVCGLTRAEDARAAWHAGARWGGVVFAPGSMRRVAPAQARAIAAATPLPLAGVFVDETPATVGEVAREVPLAAVQLHGGEDDARIEATRKALPVGCELWKAVRVGDSLPPLPRGTDRVLFDCPAPGTGTRFDWTLLPTPADMARHGLAGGIDAGNVGDALASGAGLVDVSTGVESAPGIKSSTRLAALFDAIRVSMGPRDAAV